MTDTKAVAKSPSENQAPLSERRKAQLDEAIQRQRATLQELAKR